MFRTYLTRRNGYQCITALFLTAVLYPAQASMSSPSRHLVHSAGMSVQNIQAHLMMHYRQWKGVHYLWGGESRRGIDCSAFTRSVYMAQFHIALPRTSGEQKRRGHAVSRGHLKAGDLIFFRTLPGKRHVGIYAGDGMFMHASSSHGVTLSRLNNPYWVHHFEEARRLSLT